MSRRGMTDETIREVQKVHRTLFRRGLSQEKALEQIRKASTSAPEIGALIEFVQATERGLARPPVRKKQ